MKNKKDERIKKMLERGITDPRVIARKLGYAGAALTAGIERVNEGLERIKQEKE